MQKLSQCLELSSERNCYSAETHCWSARENESPLRKYGAVTPTHITLGNIRGCCMVHFDGLVREKQGKEKMSASVKQRNVPSSPVGLCDFLCLQITRTDTEHERI